MSKTSFERLVSGQRAWRGSWLAALLMFASAAVADYPLEIIELRSRLPEDVIPTLRPLAGPDGTVVGARHSLFIRAAPDRLADIRAALAMIDRPAQSLLVQVRQQQSNRDSGYDSSARIDAPVGRDGRVIIGRPTPHSGSGVRAWAGGRQGERNITQQVRTVDGHAAHIAVGRAEPLPYRDTHVDSDGLRVREGVVYGSTSTGFQVVPRVHGEQVTLEISVGGARRNPQGRFETADVQTRVTGRLGEWIAIGSVKGNERSTNSGLLNESQARRKSLTDVELRVVPID